MPRYFLSQELQEGAQFTLSSGEDADGRQATRRRTSSLWKAKVKGQFAASSRSAFRNDGFGHAVHKEDSDSEQPAPGNTRKRFAHDFAGDRCIVVGLPPKPPAVTEPEVPAQP